jgi:hypothetical protein
VIPIGGPGLPAIVTASPATGAEPALFTLRDSAVGQLPAADVFEIGARRIKSLDGKPVFENAKLVFIPIFERDYKAADLADACLYFGPAPPDFVQPPPGLYGSTAYGQEIQRRRLLIGLPACGTLVERK